MRETEAHAGNGPAPLCAPTGVEDTEKDFTEKHVVPAVARLHSALAACDRLIARYTERAADSETYSADSQTRFALAASRLAAAQAQTAGAIARLADAESRQRVTNVKVDDAIFRPRRRAARNSPPSGGCTTRDWEERDSESQKSTFNSSSAFTGPRVRNV
jgi:hypothetical protein